MMRHPILMLALIASPWTSAALAETGGRYVVNRQGEKPRPRVIVENACAWPNLTVLRDGTIVAAIFNQPGHGNMEGDVDCWATSDQGETWRKVGTPAPHDPGTNRMNVAVGTAKNGDLVVLCSGWSNRYPPDQKGAPFRAGILPCWLCRSSDGGRTWSLDKTTLQKAPDGQWWVPYGDIVAGADGVLRATAYTRKGDMVAYVLESRDDGKTWGGFIPLSQENASRNETAILNLGDHQWIAASRSKLNGAPLYLHKSDDNGKTWPCLGQITKAGEHPAHLLQLKDGRILLSYGRRSGTVHSVEVMTSRDEGQTWSAPSRVVDWWGDGGYPSSIQLSDGQVLTAYYAHKVEGHDGYHMGTAIWDPIKSAFSPREKVEQVAE